MPNETEVSPDFVEKLADSSGGAIDPALLQHSVKPYEQWPPLLRAQPLSDPALIQSFGGFLSSPIGFHGFLSFQTNGVVPDDFDWRVSQ